MDSNMYNGVRAEPKFLRDPTSLESISTSISRISSYVTSNLPKRKSNAIPVTSTNSILSIPVTAAVATIPLTPPPSFDPSSLHQQHQHQYIPNDEGFPTINHQTTSNHSKITFASFEEERLKYRGKTIPCLVLGYVDGFQIWNIADPDNVHEICSVRDPQLFLNVSAVHILKHRSYPSKMFEEDDGHSEMSSSSMSSGFEEEEEPILAIVSENATTTNTAPPDQDDDVRSTTTMNSLNPVSAKASRIIIYGLKSQSIIREITDLNNHTSTATGNEEDTSKDDTIIVTCIQSNHKVIALGCLSRYRSFIQLFHTKDFTPFASPITDVYHDVQQGPTFTLGSRLIAYATNAAVLNSDPVMSTATLTTTTARGGMGSSYPHGNLSSSSATTSSHSNNPPSSLSFLSSAVVQKYDKDAVKGAAKDIAKEVVSGMKTLSEYGLNTLSNYFNNGGNGSSGSNSYNSPITSTLSSSPSNINYRRASTGMNYVDSFNHPGATVANAANATTAASKKSLPSGMVMIRDISKLPKQPTRNLSLSVIAHFRPHTHPVSCLRFNPAGTLLISASKQGHTFHVFSILTPTYLTPSSPTSTTTTAAAAAAAAAAISNTFGNSTAGNVTHLYSLNRGITDAQVEDCQFSLDSTWCAVSTARGTTHVYAINPYGGKPEIMGHIYGKVNNPFHPPIQRRLHPSSSSGSNSHGKTFPSKVKAVGLSSAVRIKQRRKMPGNPATLSHDDLATAAAMAASLQPTGYGYYGQPVPAAVGYIPGQPPSMMAMTAVAPPATRMDPYHQNKEHRAKLISLFVTGANTHHDKSLNNSLYKPALSLSSNSNHPLVGSIKQQASNMLSSINSYYSNTNGSSTSNKNELMFGFDEEYYDDHPNFYKEQEEDLGYQDVYTFHPVGVLTLHRCWVSKTVMNKREHGGYKMNLTVKEEDIAEWNVARDVNWDTVCFDPFSTPPKAKETEALKTAATVKEEEKDSIASTASTTPSDQKSSSTSNKKKKTSQPPPVLVPSSSTSTQPTKTALPSSPKAKKKSKAGRRRKRKDLWLSNAEITTYASQDEQPPLWARHQFSFQPFQKTMTEEELTSILASGLIPPTETMQLRKDTPEPVSSRLDRIRKTTVAANIVVDARHQHPSDNQVDSASGEMMEDALAELQDNLSKAMQTTSFSPSSTNTAVHLHNSHSGSSPWLLSSPPRAMSSSSATSFVGRSPSNLLDAQNNHNKHSNSSLSFEDAYLIHMGSGPSPEPLPSSTAAVLQGEQQQQLQMSSLIQFDDDEDEVQHEDKQQQQQQQQQRKYSNSMSSLSSSLVYSPIHDEDNMNGLGRNEVFSPAGDNEIDNPYESMYGDFSRPHVPLKATIIVEEEEDEEAEESELSSQRDNESMVSS